MAVYMNMKFIYLHRIIITQICEYFVPGTGVVCTAFTTRHYQLLEQAREQRVPGTGVEPARLLRAHGPKPCVYAISPPRLAFGEYAP